VRDLRTLIDDTEVTLAFYGSIVYLAVVSALGAQSDVPQPRVAITALVSTATVLYIAHVFAAAVPKAARRGQLHRADLAAALLHDVPLLLSVIVPTIPLLLASWEVVAVDTAFRLSVRLTLVMLFGLAVTLSRRDGLSWRRSIVAGLVIIAIAIVVIWLEARIH
jgi:VIT1/CCC1 family predicted Fe2+/Mn2+ transporter